MKSFNYSFVLVLLFGTFVLSSCNKNNDEPKLSKTFTSEASIDGYITNSNVKGVSDFYLSGAGYKEICIGWDASGYSMRGFLSFDISSILPTSGNKLVIDNATLTVFEANTNLNPFSDNKLILCYLIDYGTSLDANDYDAPTTSNLGTIASASKGVLSGFIINITTQLNNYNLSNSSFTRYQFRLQSNSLSNVSNTSSDAQAMWNIFSGDQSLMGGSDFCPKLNVEYHFEKK